MSRYTQQREREFQRQQEEHEADQTRLDAVRAARVATFERILENAPSSILTPYLHRRRGGGGCGRQRERTTPAEEILLSAIDEPAVDRLTRFALCLALTGHLGIPREGETDFVAEAATAFAPPTNRKEGSNQKAHADQSGFNSQVEEKTG